MDFNVWSKFKSSTKATCCLKFVKGLFVWKILDCMRNVRYKCIHSTMSAIIHLGVQEKMSTSSLGNNFSYFILKLKPFGSLFIFQFCLDFRNYPPHLLSWSVSQIISLYFKFAIKTDWRSFHLVFQFSFNRWNYHALFHKLQVFTLNWP